ncbi:MAG: hypothetical protein JO366_02085 [Methylobacteriaceae bacterium]|nr:hypothetical protein [Methylobacteriaceae bacterium]MBV9243583.1 hypothetical protein [Methylobacteriaceae bacterium]MBV9633985.1 hypothetical protein [Methylobacteriaceae bacterium]MBV9702566.1 hypothetical protein [Methylobacteriaceae bacterium]
MDDQLTETQIANMMAALDELLAKSLSVMEQGSPETDRELLFADEDARLPAMLDRLTEQTTDDCDALISSLSPALAGQGTLAHASV